MSQKKLPNSREARAAAARKAQNQAEARRRRLLRGGALMTLIAVIVGLGIIIQSNRLNQQKDASAPPPRGTTGVKNQSISVGAADAGVTLTIYEDFQCPACKAFEAAQGARLSKLVQAGKIRIDYRPVAFLDRASTTNYSTRALTAVGCVVDQDPSKYAEFHRVLFENQPEEGTAGLTNEALAQLAKDVGAPEISACLSGGDFKAWTARVTEQFSQDEITGTPTVLLNGRRINGLDAAAFEGALAANIDGR